MATVTWTGATNNDWNTGTNWSGGSAPSNDDTVIIDGNVSIAGYDASSVHLDYLFIRPTYTGQFGTSAATPVKVAVDNACSVQGGSAVYLNSGGSNPIVSLVVNMPDPFRIVDLGGTITSALIQRGAIYTAATYTNLAVYPVAGQSGNVSITFNGGTITVLDCAADAKVQAATTITTANILGGRFRNLLGTLTTVNIIGSTSRFDHYHTATITTVETKAGGVLDASVDGRAKTITNIIRDPYGKVSLNNGSGNITVTNGVKTPARITDSEYGDFSTNQSTSPFFSG